MKQFKQGKRMNKADFLKSVMLLCCILLLPLQANITATAATTTPANVAYPLDLSDPEPSSNIWQQPTYDKKMIEVGTRIMKANEIGKLITFLIMPGSEDVESTAAHKKDVIKIGSGIFPFIQSDDELAAILSHEMAHLINNESGHFVGMTLFDILGTVIFIPEAVITSNDMGMSIRRKLSHVFASNHESEMDIIGLKLMVKAGYNPVAMESVLTKLATDDENKRHRKRQSLELRKQRIHAEIRQHYPQFLVSDAKNTEATITPENKHDTLTPSKDMNLP
jgi:Zn-dependent protease with chaperone function